MVNVQVMPNMFALGVDPKLDFSNMPEIIEMYERVTRMHVYERQPYAGKLVFAAFSGSHQDAISKGMHYRIEQDPSKWTVPYLPINPEDVGRTYDSDVIRINSQSGKGGVAYVLKQNFGLMIPDKMREEVGYLMKGVSDHAHAELSPNDMLEIFRKNYKNIDKKFDIPECHFVQVADGIKAEVTIEENGQKQVVEALGNGRLNAVSKAIRKHYDIVYHLAEYEEHSLSKNSNAQAMSYVGITDENDNLTWGVGTDEDIIKASIHALVNAVNKKFFQK